jgi:hypothetical protein
MATRSRPVLAHMLRDAEVEQRLHAAPSSDRFGAALHPAGWHDRAASAQCASYDLNELFAIFFVNRSHQRLS